jgi:homoserine O-succinyltransferase/O-acetyltransferase
MRQGDWVLETCASVFNVGALRARRGVSWPGNIEGRIGMPVLLDGGPHGYRAFAATEDLRGRSRPEFREGDASCIDLGLINNMPDSALETTERQVLKLIDAAAGDILVRLRLYSLPNVPRSDLGQQHIAHHNYFGSDDLFNGRLDGLIVTGAEPRVPDLAQEPYWSTLTQVIDWAEQSTLSTIWSCLAVHAAVLHFDGIVRRALSNKCFGIFAFEQVSTHPMLNGTPSLLRTPHSRWNEVEEDALASCGYTILTRSQEAGVDTFVRQQKSLFMFFQGHPEYESGTLLGEYRRDIGRFLRKEKDVYPAIPRNYFDCDAERILHDFQKRALTERRDDLLASFPYSLLMSNLTDAWRETAVQLYRNWLVYISTQKSLNA